jgi:DNA-binding SARP family transcriptional activator
MPFIAKSAMPSDPDPAAEHQVFHGAARGGHTLITASPGYLLTEGLSAALQRQGRRVLWLRLGPEDRDPGVLLLSLIAAARRYQPQFGERTLELMRADPGPISGWPLLFTRLAEELRELLSKPVALVLQHAHHLEQARSTLQLLGSHLLSPLEDQVACIITSSRALPAATLPASIVHRSARDLRLADTTISRLLQLTAPDLSNGPLHQIAEFCQGQAALLAAAGAARTELGPAVVERGIVRSTDPQDFLRFLAQAWLATMDVDGRRALSLALRLGYIHSTLATAVLGVGRLPLGPWLQPLSDGWLRVRTVWKAPLRSALVGRRLLGNDAIHRAADFLVEIGAVEQAVPLYLQLKDADCVAQTIADEADRLMNLGLWETIGEWLSRLPNRVLKVRPWLVYHEGEIAAAQLRVPTAQRLFSTATTLFTGRHEPEGACQSMLAESALAVGQMDFARAEARALAASAMAEAAGSPRYQAWAAWQLGSLALITEKPDAAAANFGRAAEIAARIGSPALLDLPLEAERLTSHLQEVRRRREEHFQALDDLEAAEFKAAERVRAHVATAYERAANLIQLFGWSHTPLALRLPTLPPDYQASSVSRIRRWWLTVRKLIVGHRSAAPAAQPADGEGADTAPGLAPAFPPLDAHTLIGELPGGAAAPAAPLGRRESPQPPPAEPASEHPSSLTVHLLGRFRVTLNDTPVDSWPSARGRALFKYLLTHRDPWPSREVIMEVFWPESALEAARNNLHVAIHGLRSAFRTVGDIPVVVFERGGYRLHPDLQLWVDVDEFDRHMQGGHQLEAAGELAAAMAEYELAVSLYQGDFLSDDLYEEWAVLTRERLRLAYLETVDRLSHLYFSQGRYAPCVALCQRILERDPCREDAHRRLMRCYSRQGQQHLALRQYRSCAEALKAELSIEPAAETDALRDQIQRRETV